MALMEMKVMTKIAQVIKNVTEEYVTVVLVVVNSKNLNEFFSSVFLILFLAFVYPKNFAFGQQNAKVILKFAQR